MALWYRTAELFFCSHPHGFHSLGTTNCLFSYEHSGKFRKKDLEEEKALQVSATRLFQAAGKAAGAHLLAEEFGVLEEDGREKGRQGGRGEKAGILQHFYFRSALEHSYNLSYELKPPF